MIYNNSPQFGAIQGIFSLLQQRDIDQVNPQLLYYFFYEFLPNIPVTILANPALLAKHIKDFYTARGSEASFRILFQILFNDYIKFYYPKTDMMVLDSGIWSVDTVIRTTTTNNTSLYIGRQIIGLNSQATANIENVLQITYGTTIVSEIYISNIMGIFIVGEPVNVTIGNTTYSEIVYGIVTGINITNPGTGYNYGDIIPIEGSNQTALYSVNVTGGTFVGRVVPTGTTATTIQLSSMAASANGYYDNMEITIIDGTGEGQTNIINSYDGSTQIATLNSALNIVPDITSHYSINLGQIQTVMPLDFGFNYTTVTNANFSSIGNGDAIGTINIGAMGNYAGHYVNNSGFLDEKYLQDDYYYQNFSYVLRTHESVSQYFDVVKKLLHPVGLILFGDFLIEGNPFYRQQHNISITIFEDDGGEFTYYINPFTGNDSNNGLTPETAWLTTTNADALTLTGSQSIGYYYNRKYELYRSLGMTADQTELIASIVTETADKF